MYLMSIGNTLKCLRWLKMEKKWKLKTVLSIIIFPDWIKLLWCICTSTNIIIVSNNEFQLNGINGWIIIIIINILLLLLIFSIKELVKNHHRLYLEISTEKIHQKNHKEIPCLFDCARHSPESLFNIYIMNIKNVNNTIEWLKWNEKRLRIEMLKMIQGKKCEMCSFIDRKHWKICTFSSCFVCVSEKNNLHHSVRI